jgi:hypothetical protein
VARLVERSGAYRVLVGRSEGRTKFGRPRSRWVDYIKMDLQEVGWRNIKRIDLAQNRERWRGLVNAVMKPSGSIKCWEFLD